MYQCTRSARSQKILAYIQYLDEEYFLSNGTFSFFFSNIVSVAASIGVNTCGGFSSLVSYTTHTTQCLIIKLLTSPIVIMITNTNIPTAPEI
jgi:hypothetical protein